MRACASRSLHDLERRLYAGGRPNRLARWINGAWARAASAGLGPGRLETLEVRGRRSGGPVSLPVVVAEFEGERYLVSMLGEDASWVANVRAAGGRAALVRGRRTPVVLEEVPPRMRAPILRRYLDVAPGARAHVEVERGAPVEAFDRVADRYPVFRIRS